MNGDQAERPPLRRRLRPHLVDVQQTRCQTSDRDKAEQLVAELYLPHQLDLSRDPAPLQMEFAGQQVGGLTAGLLSYGRPVGLRTVDAQNYHVNTPVRGRLGSSMGSGEPVATRPGQGLIFSPGAPADIAWSPDSEQLCLMIPRARVELALERLLDQSLRSELVFDFQADLETPEGRRLRSALDLIADELDSPTRVGAAPAFGRHLEELVVDCLLLGQRHNLSDVASRPAEGGSHPTISRAVDLLEGRPDEPWSTVRLATEVHLSVRALQEGFRRDLGASPMTYLRQVRLRRAYEALGRSAHHDTTVRAVATNLGWMHLGRFAAAYKAAFGESPSETLNRHQS